MYPYSETCPAPEANDPHLKICRLTALVDKTRKTVNNALSVLISYEWMREKLNMWGQFVVWPTVQ